MNLSPRPPKTASRLPDSLRHQLNLYAIAAGAAGVGMLANAQAVAAKVVYTPAHTRIHGILALDLNHEGVVDYSLKTQLITGSFGMSGRLGIYPALRNQICRGNTSHLRFFATAFPAGKRLGAKRQWQPGTAPMATYTTFFLSSWHDGPWFDVQHRYLGLKFLVNGRYHYGWARLNTKMSRQGIDAVLTGYAYETIPNKPIITGKTKGPDVITAQPDAAPGSLGRLALGRK